MTQDYLFNKILDELSGANGAITGWCEEAKALDLAAMVLALHPKVVVELGVWGGRSFIPMALACKHVGTGVVIGIDPWSPEASAEGYDTVNADWWSKQPHEQVYRGFVDHLTRLDLLGCTAIRRVKSDDAEVPPVVDALHVDAQHCAHAIRDVKRFAPAVRIGGIVCMDDLEWTTNGIAHVKQAVAELLALGFVELHRTKTEKGCWGFFQRVLLPALAPDPAVSQQRTGRGRAVRGVKPK